MSEIIGIFYFSNPMVYSVPIQLVVTHSQTEISWHLCLMLRIFSKLENGEVLGLVLRDDEGCFSLERTKNSIGCVTMLGDISFKFWAWPHIYSFKCIQQRLGDISRRVSKHKKISRPEVTNRITLRKNKQNSHVGRGNIWPIVGS